MTYYVSCKICFVVQNQENVSIYVSKTSLKEKSLFRKTQERGDIRNEEKGKGEIEKEDVKGEENEESKQKWRPSEMWDS